MITRFSRKWAALGVWAVLLASSAARADLITSYSITIDEGLGDVSAVTIGERIPAGPQITFPFIAPAGQTTVVEGLFPMPAPPLGAALLGVIEDSTVFGGGHVVLMVSDAAAAMMEGRSWESLFRYTREADLASHLLQLGTGAPSNEISESIGFVLHFVWDYLSLGIWDPSSQTLVPYMFELGDTFTVMKFSDGTRIGRGTSRIRTESAVVPEPGSATLLATGAGIVAIGTWRRARRRGVKAY